MEQYDIVIIGAGRDQRGDLCGKQRKACTRVGAKPGRRFDRHCVERDPLYRHRTGGDGTQLRYADAAAGTERRGAGRI